MEDARLAKQLRDKESLVNSAQAISKAAVQDAASKKLPPKVMMPGKKVPKVKQHVAPVSVAAATPAATAVAQTKPQPPVAVQESVIPDTAPKNRGFFVGLGTNGKPFFKIVGSVSDTEYLALVKFAELQLGTTLDLYSPTSNLKIMKLLQQLTGDKEPPKK
jgi:hypothetical protein